MSIANTNQKTIIEEGIIDAGDQTLARVEHLKELESKVGNSYPNKFERSKITGREDTISNIVNFEPIKNLLPELAEGERPAPEVKEEINAKLREFGNARVSGRLAVPPRVMGKAAFVHLSDGVQRLQIYIRKQDAVVISNDTGKAIEEEGAAWEVFGLLDHGDFIGVEGYLFLTNTGELSVHVETLQFLSKALLPMPDKMHGIADPELRRRFRYADLIADSLKIDHEPGELTTREVFERRAKLISGMRNYLDAHGFIEVETPILTPKATGAAAEPFETYHKALDIKLYARIAPELYLKRLTVGGFEKVYELNRNFRNEGLSHKHSPEFTMLEFYCAYMDVNGMMDFCEVMLKEAVQKANRNLQVKIDEVKEPIDFSKFERLTMKQAVALNWKFPTLKDEKFESQWLDDLPKLRQMAVFLRLLEFSRMQSGTITHFTEQMSTNDVLIESFRRQEEFIEKHKDEYWHKASLFTNNVPSEEIASEFEIKKELLDHLKRSFDFDAGQERQEASFVEELFEKVAESKLIQPTFIIDYPKSISPLSKASPENPQIAERFELFINGMECANGFSELNDPQEQYERFLDQMREREGGDEEAMILDEDYIRALAYGMPPAAGIGIGIDRLVMLLTNKHSIRDVILFPHMRPEKKDEEKGRKGEEEKEN